MSSLFARDFSGVRVHSDDAAGAAAAALDARAFTVGRHIVFGSGQYAPTTPRGRSLIAHELAHTAQQPASENPDKRLEASPADGPHERQATQWAARARAAGTPRGADARPIGGGSMHRIPVLATGRQMVQRQSVFTTAMQTDRRARPTTPADQFAVAEAAGRSAGSEYGEVMASTADAEKTLHIKELEARIAKGGYDPEKIRPIVESVAKVRAAMSAEVEDALAGYNRMLWMAMRRKAAYLPG